MSINHQAPGYGETTDGRARHYRITSGNVVVSEDCHYCDTHAACERAEREGRYADRSDDGHARFTVTPINNTDEVTIINI